MSGLRQAFKAQIATELYGKDFDMLKPDTLGGKIGHLTVPNQPDSHAAFNRGVVEGLKCALVIMDECAKQLNEGEF